MLKKLNAKVCHTNNITLSHHLLTLYILLHEGLELLLPKFWAAVLLKYLVKVSISTVAEGKMTWLVENTL